MSFFNNAMNIMRNASAPDATLTLLAKLQSQGTLIMATLAEVQNALTKLANAAAVEKAEALAAQLASTDSIKALTEQVAGLKAQLANGTTVSTADLDALLAQINGIDSAVQSIIPTPV